MAKDLDKFTKELAPLERAAHNIIGDYEAHRASRDKIQGMLTEAAREVGRVAAQLKAGGATGTKLADFAAAKEMTPAIKASMDALAAAGKEEGRLGTVVKQAGDTSTALEKLQRTIVAEVAERKRKKDRAVAAIDSKSLPEMEKLADTVGELKSDLADGIVRLQRSERWSLSQIKGLFEKWCTEEIAKSKTQIAARDTSDKDKQAFDLRIVSRQTGQVKQIVTGAQTACANAERFFKNHDTTSADKELGKAWALHAELKKILAPYTRQLASINNYDRQTMQGSKDGKAVLDFVANLEKAVDGVSKMIKKFSRATI